MSHGRQLPIRVNGDAFDGSAVHIRRSRDELVRDSSDRRRAIGIASIAVSVTLLMTGPGSSVLQHVGKPDDVSGGELLSERPTRNAQA